jgi:hypothetical protein
VQLLREKDRLLVLQTTNHFKQYYGIDTTWEPKIASFHSGKMSGKYHFIGEQPPFAGLGSWVNYATEATYNMDNACMRRYLDVEGKG